MPAGPTRRQVLSPKVERTCPDNEPSLRSMLVLLTGEDCHGEAPHLWAKTGTVSAGRTSHRASPRQADLVFRTRRYRPRTFPRDRVSTLGDAKRVTTSTAVRRPGRETELVLVTAHGRLVRAREARTRPCPLTLPSPHARISARGEGWQRPRHAGTCSSPRGLLHNPERPPTTAPPRTPAAGRAPRGSI
jgi:hypothetical protein